VADTALTTVLEIAGLSVTLPIKFSAGHTLTDTQARILDAAYQRQFTNNQNATAKSRAEAHAKGTADKAPLTAEQIASIYLNYEPAVGGSPRQSAVERMRHEAGWRAIVSYFGEHNENVRAGGAGLIAKANGKVANLPAAPRKVDIKAANAAELKAGTVSRVYTEEELTAAHTAAVEAFNGVKTTLIERFLALPEHTARIQTQLDAVMAERGAKKVEAPIEASVAAADLF
jgi:hypothetical protein